MGHQDDRPPDSTPYWRRRNLASTNRPVTNARKWPSRAGRVNPQSVRSLTDSGPTCAAASGNPCRIAIDRKHVGQQALGTADPSTESRGFLFHSMDRRRLLLVGCRLLRRFLHIWILATN